MATKTQIPCSKMRRRSLLDLLLQSKCMRIKFKWNKKEKRKKEMRETKMWEEKRKRAWAKEKDKSESERKERNKSKRENQEKSGKMRVNFFAKESEIVEAIEMLEPIILLMHKRSYLTTNDVCSSLPISIVEVIQAYEDVFPKVVLDGLPLLGA